MPALRNPAIYVASNKPRIFGAPQYPPRKAFTLAMLE
jgi:hypothetical protein